jgi:hypothetical protein
VRFSFVNHEFWLISPQTRHNYFMVCASFASCHARLLQSDPASLAGSNKSGRH